MSSLIFLSIQNALHFLIEKQKHFLIIEFDKYYVQFMVNGTKINMEAVSEINMGINNGIFTDEFEKIGFLIGAGDNYTRQFLKEDIEGITEVTVFIMDNIYKVESELSLGYNIILPKIRAVI